MDYLDSPVMSSGSAIRDFLQEQLVGGVDDHLIEFSEAMRTVAKVLRHVAEGKASAQAETAEWKRKYELERARNQKLRNQESSRKSIVNDLESAPNQKTLYMHGEPYMGKHDICSHDILQDKATEYKSKSSFADNHATKKVPFRLSWGCNTRGLSGQHKQDIVSFEKGNITTAERSSRQISLKWESQPKTVIVMTKPNSVSVRILCNEMVRWLNDQKGINVIVEPRVKSELLSDNSYFSFVKTWKDDVAQLHMQADLVITLGGDGTVLWGASIFKGPTPPFVPFSLGSLGFMTPFQSDSYKECLNKIFEGPINITLRNRLQCHVIRDSAKNEILDTEDPILVLNEVTLDRGISSYLTNLECYCDSSFVTTVQGDGLIVSTTSGSTAYSLAAGGSMVHPQVPGILFTPICPHSLSFRPLIFQECATLRIQVPYNSRGHAWVSFDGKDRTQLGAGDALVISMAAWPVPMACQTNSTTDFLRSIHEGLHWNVRKNQSSDGPPDS